MCSQVKMIKKNKRGISVMVGYVLLVVFAIAVGTIVYTQLKTYVPTEDVDCPDGTSLFIQDITCSSERVLSITLKNNGRFNIGGYFINAANDSGQETATIDLSEYTNALTLNPGVAFFAGSEDLNPFEPGYEEIHTFNLEAGNLETIYLVEILPLRWQVEDDRNRVVSCKNSKIQENIVC